MIKRLINKTFTKDKQFFFKTFYQCNVRVIGQKEIPMTIDSKTAVASLTKI